jgi:hypothetical protein
MQGTSSLHMVAKTMLASFFEKNAADFLSFSLLALAVCFAAFLSQYLTNLL